MGGKSSSKAATTTNTTAVDKRLVVDGNSVGISAEGSNVTVNTLDAGIVGKALDTVQAADATNGEGFDKLLGLADKLFTQGGELISNTSQATLQQVAALNTAQNDQKGAIDQKTIMVLGIAGAVAIVAANGGFK